MRPIALIALMFSLPAFAAAPNAPEANRQPKIQIAILLDNSGSMSGLLNQARTQLWAIVNEFATATKNGQRPRIEIGLYEYGDGIVRHSHLTSDLDAVSEKLFGLGVRGGDEHCGAVIQRATKELEWSGHRDDLRLIYIAGNEPFTQGPVDYREAIAAARRKNIIVNTIHCGGDDSTWRAGATVAGGDYLMINHNARVATVVAPQDAKIAQLNARLNATYVAYGAGGEAAATRQREQDKAAAAAAPSAMAQRAVAKAGAHYSNAQWDLVDATKEGAVKLEEVGDAALPEPMRGMNAEQRKAFVESKRQERETIQREIQALSEERKKYVAEAAKSQPAESTFDTALVGSAWKQAEAASFAK